MSESLSIIKFVYVINFDQLHKHKMFIDIFFSFDYYFNGFLL